MLNKCALFLNTDAMNTSYVRSIKKTPYEVMFGRKVETPILSSNGNILVLFDNDTNIVEVENHEDARKKNVPLVNFSLHRSNVNEKGKTSDDVINERK